MANEKKTNNVELIPPIAALMRMTQFNRDSLHLSQTSINETSDSSALLYGPIAFEKENFHRADILTRLVCDQTIANAMSKIIERHRKNF